MTSIDPVTLPDAGPAGPSSGRVTGVWPLFQPITRELGAVP